MDRDRNLLFGILAVQLRKLTPSQLVEAAAAWATDPTRTLATRLVDAGILSERDRQFIDDVVQRAIDDHQGDPAATINAFGGDAQVFVSFGGSIVPTSGGGIETAASPADALRDLESVPAVQETPGRYTHMGEFGRGGMGRVLLVHDEHLNRDIAMKELLPTLTGSDSGKGTPVRRTMPFVARFLQEARITGRLEHPSIVPVYELGHTRDGGIYYTMKLVRGKTLADAIREAKTLEDRLKLLPNFVDLCNAIAYAHSRGVIHRDIKPANTMVGDFGETVVLDWGLAKAVGREDTHEQAMRETLLALSDIGGDKSDSFKTQYGQALGTAAYMSPEQARGELDKVDARSDVYSLGVVLFELLTGQRPFDGKSTAEILHKVLKESPSPIPALAPGAPPELAAICEKAMAKDRDGRYPSALALSEEIQRFQSGALVGSYEYGTSELFWRFVRRHRAPIAVATGALLVVVAGLSVATWQVWQAGRRVQIAKQEVSIAQEEVEVANQELHYKEEEVKLLRADALSDQYLIQITLIRKLIDNEDFAGALKELWQTPESERDWEWGYFLHLLDSALKVVPGDRIVSKALFLQQGKLLARSFSDGADFTVCESMTGNTLVEVPGEEEWIVDFQFNLDASQVCIARANQLWKADNDTIQDISGSLTIYSLADSSVIRRISVEALTNVIISPDLNKAITLAEEYYTVSGRRYGRRSMGGIRLWDLDTGLQVPDFPDNFNLAQLAVFSIDGRILATPFGGDVRIFNADTGQESLRIRTPIRETPRHLCLSKDNSKLLICHDNVFRVVDTSTGYELDRSVDFVPRKAQFSEDGKLVYDTSANEIGLAYDLDSKTVIDSPITNIDEVLLITEQPAIAAQETSTPEETITNSPNRLTNYGVEVAASYTDLKSNDTQLQVAYHDGSIRFWGSNSMSPRVQFPIRDAFLVGREKENMKLIGRSAQGAIEVWRLNPFSKVLELQRDGTSAFTGMKERDVPLHFSVSVDDNKLAVMGQVGIISIWDLSTGFELISLESNGRDFQSGRFSPDGGRFLAQSVDGLLTVWDSISGARLLADIQAFDRNSVRFGEDGTKLLGHREANRKVNDTSRTSGNIVVWDITTNQEILSIPNCSIFDFYETTESPNGQFFATISDSKLLQVWDLTTGLELEALRATDVSEFVFEPSSSRIITSDRHSAVIRSIPDGQIVGTLPVIGGVRFLEFSDDGRLISEFSASGPSHWDLSTGARVELANPKENSQVEENARRTWREIASPDFSEGVPATPSEDEGIVKAKLIGNSGVHEYLELELPVDYWHSGVGFRSRFIESDSKLLFIGSNEVTIFSAAPYRLDQLPGDDTQTWEERYELWRQERYKKWLEARGLDE